MDTDGLGLGAIMRRLNRAEEGERREERNQTSVLFPVLVLFMMW